LPRDIVHGFYRDSWLLLSHHSSRGEKWLRTILKIRHVARPESGAPLSGMLYGSLGAIIGLRYCLNADEMPIEGSDTARGEILSINL
jgi:hypothetical protein